MTRLTELGKKYGTDKATYHLYTELYEDYFKPFVRPTIMEIGIYHGSSIHMYQEFWNLECDIVGLDRGDQLTFKNPYQNVKLYQVDQGIREQLLTTVGGPGFDIILDDGSHMISHQLISLATLFPYLKAGGIYIVEDLQTSHAAVAYHYNSEGLTNTLDFLDAIKNKTFPTNTGLSDDEVNYLLENVASVDILYPRGPLLNPAEGSVTSVIRKISV